MTPTPQGHGLPPFAQPVRLTAGTHTLKLDLPGDGQNLDWFELAPYVRRPTPMPTPNGSTPYKALAIPGTIQAEDYDLGGEGVAYHDTTPGNRAARTARTTSTSRRPAAGHERRLDPRTASGLTYTATRPLAGIVHHDRPRREPEQRPDHAALGRRVAAATIAVPNTGLVRDVQTVHVPGHARGGTAHPEARLHGRRPEPRLDRSSRGPDVPPIAARPRRPRRRCRRRPRSRPRR